MNLIYNLVGLYMNLNQSSESVEKWVLLLALIFFFATSTINHAEKKLVLYIHEISFAFKKERV